MIAWRTACAGAKDVTLERNVLVVSLGRDRTHKVEVEATADAIELRAVVARQSEVKKHPGVTLAAWNRNRSSCMVGFRIDQRGRLLGESWVPVAGLTADEFLLYVRNLAAACDLFEFQLTGEDRE